MKKVFVYLALVGLIAILAGAAAIAQNVTNTTVYAATTDGSGYIIKTVTTYITNKAGEPPLQNVRSFYTTQQEIASWQKEAAGFTAEATALQNDVAGAASAVSAVNAQLNVTNTTVSAGR